MLSEVVAPNRGSILILSYHLLFDPGIFLNPVSRANRVACPCSPGVDFKISSASARPNLSALPNAAMACGPIVVASAITARQVMKRDLYAEVSARIVAELGRGRPPLG
jgi:hypothetical protein